MDQIKILIVDDSEMNRSILADMLGEEFVTVEAENGETAVDILRESGREFSLVLLDIVMPVMDGFGVLTEMKNMRLIEELPVIMVSAEKTPAQVELAYELGATDFIMRPFDAAIVRRRVMNTLLLYAKQKKLLGIIEEQIRENEQNSSLMVDVLSHIVEFRNGESGLHIWHVRTITEFLLRKLATKTVKYPLDETEITIISMASALHDIGKIAIDDKILNKPGKLTPEEFAVMKTHSIIGARMLEGLTQYRGNPLVRKAYEICRWHHERYDGKGYPDGLVGDEIPISAQIVALADVYDALTSARVYKPPFTPEKAEEMILTGQCGVFNPLLLECLSDEFVYIREALEQEAKDGQHAREIRRFSDALGYAKNTSTSDRTLKLLDYERMKYNFYAELTEEIQFEYRFDNDMLIFSPWGAKKFGVEAEIMHPALDTRLRAQLGKNWFESFKKLVMAVAPEKQDFRYECELAIGGEKRWYNIIVRAMWTDDLPPRIESFIGKIVDVNDMHNTITALKENSIRDPLTGLLNRAGVLEDVGRKLSRFGENKYAIAVFDIDLFKSANDTYGHLFGDRVLREVADRLVHSTRAGDLCARIGGDEFLIIFEYNTDIHPIIARVFHALCGEVDGFTLSVSMGVCEMASADETYTGLFRKADVALYVCKKTGRGQFRYYDESMEGEVLPAEETQTEI